MLLLRCLLLVLGHLSVTEELEHLLLEGRIRVSITSFVDGQVREKESALIQTSVPHDDISNK